MLQDQDSSGLELTEEDGVGVAEEVGRLVISHQLPRLVVLGGAETWRSYAVCHRSCLRRLAEDDINIRKVSVFTGARGTRARLGVLLNNGTDIDTDIMDGEIVKR